MFTRSISPQAIATDFTGTVEAVGSKISDLKPGDTVVGTLSRKGSRVAMASHLPHIEPLGRYVRCHTDLLQRGTHHRALLVHSTGLGPRLTSC
jgi:NADPH:quinone reductase-like Zn-dependent oxidoreductase